MHKQHCKPVILYLCFVGLSACGIKNIPTQKQLFLGRVEYDYTYTSALLNTDSLKKVKPHTGIFLYDTGHYESRFYGRDTVVYIYSGNANKAVSQTNGRWDTACEDYSVYTDTATAVRLLETTEKVQGSDCSILEFTGRYFATRYWVSKRFILSPAVYNRHNAYNWRFYAEHSGGGLILKLEHRFKQYTMHGVARKIVSGNDSHSAINKEAQQLLERCGK